MRTSCFFAELSFCWKSEISSDVITNETKGNPFTFSLAKPDKQTNRQTDKLFGSIVCRNIGHSSEWQWLQHRRSPMKNSLWYEDYNMTIAMIMCWVLISYCFCRMLSWTPKIQSNDSSGVVWLSFWFSTRFTRKTVDYSNGSYLY